MKKSYAIGIDIGGSSLKCGVVDTLGNLVYTFNFPISNMYAQGENIALILTAIRKCVAHVSDKIIGVGIGFPGIVDKNVIIGGADNLPGFVNVDLGDIISSATHLDVVIDNDVNMMGAGEQLYGAGVGCSDVLFLTVGTGIGGSLIIKGEAYSGYKNRGGEIGHIPIVHNGKKCACGGIGCLEAYAAVPALVTRYKELMGGAATEEITGELIARQYRKQQPQAIAAFNEHFDYLSSGIAGLINVFSPQKVVIGGGISEADFYVPEIAARVPAKAIPISVQHTLIVKAELGNQAGLMGCAAKVFQTFSRIFYEA
ncbi:ROK family protein [Mucilaginibacter yixingensis]|nr:ROK family protein [Mucilaginibacter yixingensis]